MTQLRVNRKQRKINKKQTEFNENTRIDLSVKSIFIVAGFFVTLIGVWFNLAYGIKSTNDKLDIVLKKQTELNDFHTSLDKRYGDLALSVRELQTLVGINGRR